jgi:hypothetical protein
MNFDVSHTGTSHAPTAAGSLIKNTHCPVTILDIQCTIQDKLRNYLDQLNEGDEKTPGMRSIYNQSLQQHPCDLLLYNFLRKSMQE